MFFHYCFKNAHSSRERAHLVFQMCKYFIICNHRLSGKYLLRVFEELNGAVVSRLDYGAGDPESIPAGAESQTGT